MKRLVSLLQCEWMKLKNSKMLLVSVLGAMVTPFMLFVEILKESSDKPDFQFTYYTLFSHSNFYMILIFGLVVYTVFTAFLYSREYTENTLKMILTIPVSRHALLISKFIVLLIWCVLLSVLSWIFCLIISCICGAAGFSIVVLAKSLWENIYATTILVFTLTPLIYLSILTKGIVVPVITSATILMVNAALSNESYASLFPWSASYLLATKGLDPAYPKEIVIAILIFTSVAGMVLSFWYFEKNDVK